MVYAAATDSTMVMDLSYSMQNPDRTYEKAGISVVMDFDEDEINIYPHVGRGAGVNNGFSYSTGVMDNYEKKEDYEGFFIDTGASNFMGADYAWNPLADENSATNSKCLTFGGGYSSYVGYDYYFNPTTIKLRWNYVVWL